MLQRVVASVRRRRRERARRALAEAVRSAVSACGSGLKVNGPCRITHGAGVTLGENVNFNGMTIHGRGGVEIGDNFHSGEGCTIISANHDFDHDDAIPYGHSYVGKRVVIEDNVWLGLNAIVLPGVRIGEGAIVGAGAVVTRDVERCAVVGGNPARVLKYRDIEHYERLKAAGRFH